MTGNGHHVNAHGVHVQRHLTKRLSCICVEKNFVFAADFADFRQWLHDANLIVAVNDGACQRVRSYRILESFQIYYACLALHRQISHFKPFLLQPSARIQNTFVVYLRRDDVTFLIAVELGHSFQSHVIALSRAARENDFF